MRLKICAAAICLCACAAIVQLRFHKKTFSSPAPVKDTAPVSAQKNFPAAIAFISDDDLFSRATNAAAQSPELALAIGQRFLAQDPDDQNARAANLLIALCDAGQFQTALQLVNSAAESSQQSWLNLIFKRWAEKNPEDAMKNLDSISDNNLRAIAFRSAVDGWSESDFSSLANYAGSLPDGENRDYALDRALDNWSLQNPAGLAAWLNTAPAGVDFDKAVAEIICKTDQANRSSQTAMEWVEAMSDSALKWKSFQHVIAEWNQTDSAAAQEYIATADWLDAGQRQQARKILQASAPNIAAVTDSD